MPFNTIDKQLHFWTKRKLTTDYRLSIFTSGIYDQQKKIAQPEDYKETCSRTIPYHYINSLKSSYGLLLHSRGNLLLRPIFVSAMCVALHFINDFGSPFKLDSPLKHDGYLVNGSEFKLRFIVDHPKLHSYVKFSARDPAGESNLVLNGKSTLLEQVVPGCPIFRKISVKSQQGDFTV